MQQHAGTSRNIETVNTYLDGFRKKNDHEQILSCLTDDIEWTVRCLQSDRQGVPRQAIDGAPNSSTLPSWRGGAWSRRATSSWRKPMARRSAAGGEMRMSMAEAFVVWRDGRIAERRAG